MSDDVTIRRAGTIEDYRACQEAQRLAWGIADESYIVPIATMVGAQLHGGLVLGAFLPDGTAAGFSFGFLGRIDGQLGLYSQLTGVVPAQQGRGIGGRLKQAQREIAREGGLGLIAWAFDPLQAGNAHFNLARLGARSHTYVENMYGPRTDALNAGVPTDRLIAVWATTPPARPDGPPEGSESLAGFPRVIEAIRRPDGRLEPASASADAATGHAGVLLEIPDEIGILRAQLPALAERWRLAAARAFNTLFARGFEAVDFLRTRTAEGPRSFYVLRRASPAPDPPVPPPETGR